MITRLCATRWTIILLGRMAECCRPTRLSILRKAEASLSPKGLSRRSEADTELVDAGGSVLAMSSYCFPEFGIVMHRTKRPAGPSIGSNATAAVSIEPEKRARSLRIVPFSELALHRTCCFASTVVMVWLSGFRRAVRLSFRLWAYTFYR